MEARAESARRKIADCDQRLARYRQVLDAGADAAVVVRWMAEVKGERLRAEHDLGMAVPSERLTKDQIRKLVLGLRDITSVLADADPKLKAEVYAELGVQVTYDQHRRLVSVTAGPKPCTTERVGEGFATISTPATWRGLNGLPESLVSRHVHTGLRARRPHGTDATGLGLLRSLAECSASDPTLVPDPSSLGEIEPVE